MNEETPSTSLKISMGSVTSNPMSDKALFNEENKKFYKIIIILIIIDFFLNELIILHDYILISLLEGEKEEDKDNNNQEKEPELLLFFLFTILSIIIFGLILYVLYLKKLILSKITRFCYLIIGILYYTYQIIIKFIYFGETGFELDPFNIVFFIIVSLTIVPRIMGFLYIRVFERSIVKLDKAKIDEEHVNFIEKVANNLDRSTVNKNKEIEYEKELDQTVEEDEEVIFKMNNENKIVGNNMNDNLITRKKSKKKEENEEEKEEVADLS
jgi:hypothetical protein